MQGWTKSILALRKYNLWEILTQNFKKSINRWTNNRMNTIFPIKNTVAQTFDLITLFINLVFKISASYVISHKTEKANLEREELRHYYLSGLDTLSREATLSKLSFASFWKGICSKRKQFAPLSEKAWCVENKAGTINLGLVVQSIVSLTSSLVVKMLSVLVKAKMQKLLTFFQQKYKYICHI